MQGIKDHKESGKNMTGPKETNKAPTTDHYSINDSYYVHI